MLGRYTLNECNTLVSFHHFNLDLEKLGKVYILIQDFEKAFFVHIHQANEGEDLVPRLNSLTLAVQTPYSEYPATSQLLAGPFEEARKRMVNRLGKFIF